MTSGTPPRTIGLDVLRVVAVLLVFGAHIYPCPPEVNVFLAAATEFWKHGGYVGVDIFFVMSGFLVSGLIFREYQKTGAVNIPRFLARRAMKLYPPLWVLTAAGAYLYAPVPLQQLVGELLFLQNYIGNIWLHTWSLAVEEHFYLLLSAMVAWWTADTTSTQMPFRHMPALFVAVLILCFAIRLALALAFPYNGFIHSLPTHVRLDGLMTGAFVAYLWHFRGLATQQWWRRGRYGLLLVGVLLLLPAFVVDVNTETPWIYVVGNNLFTAGAVALLLGALGFQPERYAFWRGVGVVGSYSYSIYLWHLPIEIITRTILDARGVMDTQMWYLYLLIYMAGSILWGIALFRLVELPFMRLRDAWFPSKVRVLS